METLQIAYRILKGLESGKKNPYMGSMIGPAALDVDPEKWAEVMESLLEEGYIRGVVIRENILGEKVIDIENSKITLAGAQYLKENSMMKKIGDLVTNVISITK